MTFSEMKEAAQGLTVAEKKELLACIHEELSVRNPDDALVEQTNTDVDVVRERPEGEVPGRRQKSTAEGG